MKIYYDRGIIVEANGEKIFLDPELSSIPSKYPSLVTHAHSDHTAAISGSSLTYLTETTLDLYKASTTRNPRNYKIIEMNDTFELSGFDIKFLNAGHLLGAAQILIRHGKYSFLYTGDFCPEDLLTVEGANFPKEEVDITLMDATYGDYKLSFENRQQSRQNLFIWVLSQLNSDRIPLLNIGHLGGAQEIIRFFNQVTSSLPIVVDDRVHTISEVYDKNNVALKYHTFSDDDIGSILSDKCLILMPRSFKKIRKFFKKFPDLEDKVTRAIVTGQTAKYGFNAFNFASSLSTHAHYPELIETTKLLNPKMVLSHYGHHEKFAHSLLNHHNISAASFKSCQPVDVNKLEHGKRTVKPKNYFKHRPLDEFF